ncbi:unnamed protein product [Orchesella dallaii]|uniref:Uncharacterized protein n=1 Tax=Orchesella dallaii TaxID=48710 RepID=A0ABP1QQQ1_9HEXA
MGLREIFVTLLIVLTVIYCHHCEASENCKHETKLGVRRIFSRVSNDLPQSPLASPSTGSLITLLYVMPVLLLQFNILVALVWFPAWERLHAEALYGCKGLNFEQPWMRNQFRNNIQTIALLHYKGDIDLKT